MQQGSWLCPDPRDRERLLDMERRSASARAFAYGAMGLALLGAMPWLGWWPLPLLGIAVVVTVALQRLLGRSRRPEYLVAGATLAVQLICGVAIALSGGAQSPLLGIMVVPVVSLAARFTPRAVVAGVLVTAVIATAASLVSDAGAVLRNPVPLLTWAAVLAGVAAFASALIHTELEHRHGSLVDSVTGCLTRNALAQRFEELRQQARVTRQSVGIILCDIDHFKHINDTHGHARGDLVLKEVADAMRSALRGFELLYRVGGEEFLVLLPGAQADATQRLAERLRSTVQLARPGGVSLTISLGTTTASGDAVAYREMFARADTALYEAKRTGRNRAVQATHTTPHLQTA